MKCKIKMLVGNSGRLIFRLVIYEATGGYIDRVLERPYTAPNLAKLAPEYRKAVMRAADKFTFKLVAQRLKAEGF